MGEKGTLKVNGGESLSVYRARIEMPDGRVEQSPGQRHFCSRCGSALWMWDPRWPELVHPFASAIDTPLPIPQSASISCLATLQHGSSFPKGQDMSISRNTRKKASKAGTRPEGYGRTKIERSSMPLSRIACSHEKHGEALDVQKGP